MNPSSNRGMTRFSPCTIGNVCSRFRSRRTNTQCLVSARNDNGSGNVTVPDGRCGNGIVEPGEACDCGGDACNERDARCCDSMTCQWRGGAECAQSRAGGSNGSDDKHPDESWVEEHRPLVIGLSAGIGGALVLAVILAIITCCWRRRQPRKLSESESS